MGAIGVYYLYSQLRFVQAAVKNSDGANVLVFTYAVGSPQNETSPLLQIILCYANLRNTCVAFLCFLFYFQVKHVSSSTESGLRMRYTSTEP